MSQETLLPQVQLYSDGGADPNPGVGGYGVILSYKGHRKEFSAGYKLSTNNRMELTGVITGLSKLTRRSNVTVYTDSQYVVNGIEKGWAKKWKANNWMRNKNDKAVNADLWAILLDEISKHIVKFIWVKGHNGHPENERCDELATAAMKMKPLLEDAGFDGVVPVPKPKNEKPKREISPLADLVESGRKVEQSGDPCKKCGTIVVKKKTKKKAPKPGQSYYFDYYLFCPDCKTIYMVEAAKRQVTKGMF